MSHGPLATEVDQVECSLIVDQHAESDIQLEQIGVDLRPELIFVNDTIRSSQRLLMPDQQERVSQQKCLEPTISWKYDNPSPNQNYRSR